MRLHGDLSAAHVSVTSKIKEPAEARAEERHIQDGIASKQLASQNVNESEQDAHPSESQMQLSTTSVADFNGLRKEVQNDSCSVRSEAEERASQHVYLELRAVESERPVNSLPLEKCTTAVTPFAQENPHVCQGCSSVCGLVAELRDVVKSGVRERADLRLQTEKMQEHLLSKADQQSAATTVLQSKLESDLQDLRDMVVHMAATGTSERQELASVLELCRKERHEMRECGTRLQNDIDGIMEHVLKHADDAHPSSLDGIQAALEATAAKQAQDTTLARRVVLGGSSGAVTLPVDGVQGLLQQINPLRGAASSRSSSMPVSTKGSPQTAHAAAQRASSRYHPLAAACYDGPLGPPVAVPEHSSGRGAGSSQQGLFAVSTAAI